MLKWFLKFRIGIMKNGDGNAERGRLYANRKKKAARTWRPYCIELI